MSPPCFASANVSRGIWRRPGFSASTTNFVAALVKTFYEGTAKFILQFSGFHSSWPALPWSLYPWKKLTPRPLNIFF